MHKLSSLGVHMNGFGLSVALRAYLIFIRPILEYGLAIVPASWSDVQILQKAQNMCLRTCIQRPDATIGVVHIAALASLPNLFTHSHALQAKFLHRAETLPSDSLIKALTMQLDLSKEKTTWGELRLGVLWKKT
ncbi:hypothetical protein PHYBLDRAFT_167953 [Phycomyces blakesleeanus NRRL 1555(-)]|uniref:Uncharacterized protein n=1 Tax=Phycomyces blakesleeanus (strain ATCC 8743b / DSM 1359 / FGSC 10004 / NBRC 33097 / NRRL 1555) TaxID=763407 RepID=A0A162PVR3_PHYB8|nr:hypothetical protein PHYBLDRAFT_167953 [Phycomyces blakesleeanus NRRL 1555(-)]OAD74546.1 hypothetical protein PHYBLDRAFT_167953 [Phycomyces blakesleeanus NRRL 1555(-)]|eukprot:XP_018292586.1 hypothetical protein PHYBLDRAFT_167953 [Phycomyces blakesleeanus NRRL 1555(-)]